MTQGLATTFGVLAKTDNQTAVRVLLPALNSPRPAIQEGALTALLGRREPAGQREILSRVSDLPYRWKCIIQQHSERMTAMLRAALVESDESLCLNACRAAVMFDDYDVIPALLAAMENGSQTKADMAAETLLQLAAELHDELERTRQRSDHRDPQWSRRHILASLENSLQRFSRHKRREVIESFLLLANRENAVLNQILHNPHHVFFLMMVEALSRSEQPGVMRLLTSFLDDPQPPAAVINVVAARNDPKFIRYLLRHVGLEPSSAMKQNLKRIENLAWLKGGGAILDYLDNSAQHGVVQLVMASGVPRNQAFFTIKHLLMYGKPGGRREAALALAAFNGADANALAVKSLSDPDPQVQANILTHIRRRAIPGILPRLMEFISSPHLIVRQAVQQSLAEFSFQRFVDAFDMLDEEVQRTTGLLVKKIDPLTLPSLREELNSPIASRRARGLRIVRVLEYADRLEPTLLELARDTDPDVRCEAMRTLAKCKLPDSCQFLLDALKDGDSRVQEAARKGVEEHPWLMNDE